MATQPLDPDVEQLLVELRSDDAERRKAALKKIAKSKVCNAKIDGVTWTMARMDPDSSVRYWADKALLAIAAAKPILLPSSSIAYLPAKAVEPPASAPAPRSPAKPVKPLSRPAKIVQFTIGQVGWFVLNYVWWRAMGLYILPKPVPYHYSDAGPDFSSLDLYLRLLIIEIVINLIVVIVLAFKWRWVAFGMLIPTMAIIAIASLAFIVVLHFG